MTPRITIATLAHDHPGLLGRTIESVLSQTFEDFDHVIINDGGDPGPIERVVAEMSERYAGRVRLLTNDEAMGREAALNACFAASTAEYCVQLGDDDTWAPEFLERSVDFLDRHPGHGGVSSRTEVVFEHLRGESVVEDRREVLAEGISEVTFARLMTSNIVAASSFVFRRETFEAVGKYDSSLALLAEWEFTLRVLQSAPIGFLSDETLAFYHVRPDAEDKSDRIFDTQIRESYIRRALAGSDRLGDYLFLVGQVNQLEQRLTSSDQVLADLTARMISSLNERFDQLHTDVVRQTKDSTEQHQRTRSTLEGKHEGARAAASRREMLKSLKAHPMVTPPPRPGVIATPSADAKPPKRVIFYMFYDAEGVVDDYVLYKLSRLREHAEHIFVVSNGPVQASSRERLESVADTVWERENVGFDVWAYKEAQESFGWDRLAEYDELILMNYTFFGPLYPFSEVFDRMGADDCDFWGLTEHDEVKPHPLHGTGVMPRHIQSHWIAVRHRMITSKAYRSYWENMPAITSYNASIDVHETRFTNHFERAGFHHAVAFPSSNYPSQHPLFDNLDLMLADRVPIFKRRILFHDPMYLDQEVIIGRELIDRIATTGYPLDLIWSNIVRSAEPRKLYTNASMMEILPDTPLEAPVENPPRAAAVVHLYHELMSDELFDLLEYYPGELDVYVTTDNEEKKAYIEERLSHRSWTSEVRIVESNRGRDISAFVVTCRDVLLDPRYELIIKLHGKKSPQDGHNAGTWFKRHLFENLLKSPGYAGRVVQLFMNSQSLGMVFPPAIHIGYATMGSAWFSNLEPAQDLAAKLGIVVPFDKTTPLAPFGSMFIARRAALRRLAEAEFQFSNFPPEGQYQDGSLAHVIERMFGYCVLSDGYHIRTVMNPEMAAISHTFLEYKLINKAETTTEVGVIMALKTAAYRRSPLVAKALSPLYRAVRSVYWRLRPPTP